MALRIPTEIGVLIESGLWPANEEEANKQNLKCLIPEASVRALAPEESKLFLYPPPFSTVQEVMSGAEADFWKDAGTAVSEIAPALTLLIGDFGAGSDAPMALDYRDDVRNPPVIRLRWSSEGNHWVKIAASLAEIVPILTGEGGEG